MFELSKRHNREISLDPSLLNAVNPLNRRSDRRAAFYSLLITWRAIGAENFDVVLAELENPRFRLKNDRAKIRDHRVNHGVSKRDDAPLLKQLSQLAQWPTALVEVFLRRSRNGRIFLLGPLAISTRGAPAK